MNRLYVVEPRTTVTGSAADNKLPMRACDIELFARALAAKLGRGNAVSLPSDAEKWLNTVVADLQKARSNSLVIAGEQQSAALHALSHAINPTLANFAPTLYS